MIRGQENGQCNVLKLIQALVYNLPISFKLPKVTYGVFALRINANKSRTYI